jgi:hypothetical protein
VYPKGVPERTYQVDLIQTALLQNTLVVLPTGLGKTLIAAVVMYNFARWFPEVRQHLLQMTPGHVETLFCKDAEDNFVEALFFSPLFPGVPEVTPHTSLILSMSGTAI